MTNSSVTVGSVGRAPICVQHRRSGRGAILLQGRSHVIVGADELEPLIAAIQNIAHGDDELI